MECSLPRFVGTVASTDAPKKLDQSGFCSCVHRKSTSLLLQLRIRVLQPSQQTHHAASNACSPHTLIAPNPSVAMAGLIPLRLQPAPSPTGRRSSAMFPFPSPPSPQAQQQEQPQQQQSEQKELPQRPPSPPPRRPSHGRHASMSAFSPAPQPCSITLSPPPKSSRAMKHSSQPNLPTLPVLPYTPAEWKRTMAEIKRHHVGKRFRACSSRCVEILDNLKDSVSKYCTAKSLSQDRVI